MQNVKRFFMCLTIYSPGRLSIPSDEPGKSFPYTSSLRAKLTISWFELTIEQKLH